MVEIPWPTPIQSVASPSRACRRFISWRRVVKTRAPLEPRGWPRAIAPPLGFSLSMGILSSLTHERTCAAKASLSSIRSSSSRDSPSRRRSLRVEKTGPSPIQEGSSPAVAEPSHLAMGFFPRAKAFSLLARSKKAAPSFKPELFPPVTVPPFLNAGDKAANFSRDVSLRGGSSLSARIGDPSLREWKQEISPR